MNNTMEQLKPHLVKVAIATAALIGAWHFVGRRAAVAASAERSSLAITQMGIEEYAATEGMATRTPEQRVEDIHGDAQELRSFWSQSSEPKVVYDHFNALALQTGVRIASIEPRRVQSPRVRLPAEGPGADAVVTAVGYEVTLSGELDRIAEFLRAVELEAGLSRVEAFRLSPASGRDGPVRAIVSTVHPKIEKVFQILEGHADPESVAPRGKKPRKPREARP